MAAVTWTKEALRWLQDIHEFIATDNPAAAARTVEGIYRRVQSLADFPELGQRYQFSERHIRILLYGHYRIAYLVKSTGEVAILGVFHGALDIAKYEL